MNELEKTREAFPLSSGSAFNQPNSGRFATTINSPMDTGKPPKPPRSRLAPFVVGLIWGGVFAGTALFSAILGAIVTLKTPISEQISPLVTLTDGSASDWRQILNYEISQPVNILIMGLDRVPEAEAGTPEALGGRSDTLLLVRFDPQDHSVRMLSIPRDSRVFVPGVGLTKINDANVYGGAQLAQQVVSETLNGIEIDRYVRVTRDSFRQFVDAVGGVEVYVPEKMYYVDRSQNLTIDLQPGLQTLNGDQAEQFARFRYDIYGDIGRVQRQQILFKALREKAKNPSLLPKIPKILDIIQESTDTNLSWEEMLALANFIKDLEKDQLKMVMLPGRFSSDQEFDRSYWLISESRRDQVMAQYFGLGNESSPATPDYVPGELRIAIENTTGQRGLASEVAAYLGRQGFTNTYLLQDSPQKLPQTEIIVQTGNLTAAEDLKTLLGLGAIEASSTGYIDSDITVRVGLDWALKITD